MPPIPKEATVKLSFGNNLVLGNIPRRVTLAQVAEKNEKEKRDTVESFGFFDTSSPNYTTYYPDVKSEDLNPIDADFIYPVYRALSEVIVHKDWNPIDFGKHHVLRDSMKLLLGQTVNPDHESPVGNALGAIQQADWENSYTTESGLVIPAGINTKLKIDGKSNPRIARGILMDPPSIHSTSVTVQFLWEQSHPKLSGDEFFSKIGSFDEKGELIRRIATKIKRYHEISLVSHGADPYAQKINDKGEINNPLFADVSYNSTNKHGKETPRTNFFFFDLKSDLVENKERTIPQNSNNNNPTQNTQEMKEILLQFSAVLGLTLATDISEDDAKLKVQEAISGLVSAAGGNTTKLNEANTLIEANKTELTRLKEIETQYTADKANLANAATLATFKEKQTSELRARVSASYNKLAGTTPIATITELIAKADYDTLTALEIQYTTQLDEKYPVSCKSCGGKEISRASAVITPEGGGDSNKIKSTGEAAATLMAAKKKQNLALNGGEIVE